MKGFIIEQDQKSLNVKKNSKRSVLMNLSRS